MSEVQAPQQAPRYHAEQYAHYRPAYPEALFEEVFGYCGTVSRNLALDLGTGTGQAAVFLAAHFNRVLAIDSSADQLKHAVQRPNIEYCCGPAEKISLPDASVDLVTVATAFHWFEKDAFYAEMRRILKPKGILAIWTTNRAIITEPPEAADIFERTILQNLAPHWDPRARVAEEGHAGIQPQADGFGRLERHTYQIPRLCTIDQLAGLVNTWSGYAAYCQQNPDGPDILQQLREELKILLGPQLDQATLTAASQISLVLSTTL